MALLPKLRLNRIQPPFELARNRCSRTGDVVLVTQIQIERVTDEIGLVLHLAVAGAVLDLRFHESLKWPTPAIRC